MDFKSLNALSNKELWKLFPIMLSEYRDYWPQEYEKEKKLLVKILGAKSIYRLSHIGSTAVPGLLAKPTIDILLEINHEACLGSLVKSMEESGYIYSSQPDKPVPHMMFMKGYTTKGFEGQAYHVHVRYPGDWDELYFRDYLMAHLNAAQDYGKLKLELKAKYEHDRDGYTAAKTDFIRHYIRLARMEFPEKYKKQMC